MKRYLGMESTLSNQVNLWKSKKNKIELESESKLPFITISREYGCGGYAVAKEIINLINKNINKSEMQWGAYDRYILDKVMEDMGLSKALAETLTNNAQKSITSFFQTTFSKFPPQVAIFKNMVKTIKILAENGNAIIVGRAGIAITRDIPNGYHVRIVADMDWKIKSVMKNFGVSATEATKIITEKTKERDGFIKEYVKFDPTISNHYDLIVNNSKNTTEEVAKIIVESMKIKGII